MNGIEKITARIETEAVADAARIEREAAEEAEAIRTSGEAKAQEAYWQKLREGVKKAEDRVQRLEKAADMEARKSVLSFKQTLVAAAFEQAEKRLRSLTGDAYVDFLAGLAVRAATSGREEIVLGAEDRETYGAKVVKKANAALNTAGKTGVLTLSGKAGDFSGGLLLKDGNIAVNCTIAALIEQAREEQATVVAAELFS